MFKTLLSAEGNCKVTKIFPTLSTGTVSRTFNINHSLIYQHITLAPLVCQNVKLIASGSMAKVNWL